MKKAKLDLAHNHSYYINESPRTLKKKLDKSMISLTKAKKRLKISQQKLHRLKIKVCSLRAVVKHLSKREMISDSCKDQLNQTLSGVPLVLIKRLTSGKKSGRGCKYPPALKSFALTLQLYSTKAHEFVRKTFDLCLPHPAQIRTLFVALPVF